MFVLGQLKPPYDEFFHRRAWDRYAAGLHEEGLIWWFNMEISALAAHLVPLTTVSHRVPISPRLRFLSEAVNMTAAPEIFYGYHQRFLENGDLEGAAAAAGAPVLSAFEAGRGFDRLEDGHEQIIHLLEGQGGLTALAIAGLWYYKSIVEECFECSNLSSIEAAGRSLAWSERAGANNLRAHAAIFYLFACLGNAEFGKIEAVIADVEALCDLPDVSYPAKAILLPHIGIYALMRGRVQKSERLIIQNRHAANANDLPTHLRMQVHYHAALHDAFCGNAEALKVQADDIRAISFPLDMPFHSSYLHFVLGIVFLNANQPDNALWSLQISEQKAEESGSPLCENHIMMLRGQILSDRGDFDTAEQLLKTWQGIWRENGHNQYVIAAEMEMANILLLRGQKDRARRRYENARNLWPLESQMYVYARSADFPGKIEAALFSAGPRLEIRPPEPSPRIYIQTFGELKVYMGSGAVYDRQWKSRRLKQLLKALIVLGPAEVSFSRLCRILWPEKDDAAADLRAAISRLRRLDTRQDESPRPWITMKNRRVSLSPALCRVDAVRFRDRLASALSHGPGIRNIREALDLYTGDFLENDLNDVWITRHRENLKSEYIKGVLVLADRCVETDCIETAIPYLRKAIDRNRSNPDLYASLMVCHLRGGEPSKAHKLYGRAVRAFNGAAGVNGREELQRLAALLKNGDGDDERS